MGTKVVTERGNNLYEFWGDRICDVISKRLEGGEECIVVKTASAEYLKAVREERLREGATIVEVSRVGGGRLGRDRNGIVTEVWYLDQGWSIPRKCCEYRYFASLSIFLVASVGGERAPVHHEYGVSCDWS